MFILIEARFNWSQGANVPGQVQVSCDAWQADNLDAYFVATGSFIDVSGGQWKKHTVVLGFVRLQNAHNGKRLGQALYRIVDRLGIEHKVLFCSPSVRFTVLKFIFLGWLGYLR